MQEVTIFNNTFYLKKNDIYEKTDLKKIFIGDKISNNQLVESKYRDQTLIGYFSTSQTVVYGKTNSNKSFYEVTTFNKNLPKFIIAYGGKLKGKLLIKFKFFNWSDKIPRGDIIEVIGQFNEYNLMKAMLYHYNIYSKKYSYEAFRNNNEKEIKRKYFKKGDIISVDPKGSYDIDDGISLQINKEFYLISVHIAQPIYWLSEEDIIKTMKSKFSTIYIKDNQSNLWGNMITELASLTKNKKKPAYTIEFKIYIKTDTIVETKSYPSWVKLKDNISYDQKNEMMDKLLQITQKWDKSIDNYHNLISYWMIKTNNYIGIKIKDSGLPYRVNNIKNEKINAPKHLISVFKLKNIESAYYSREEFEHKSLNLTYYTHFTSPIRRIIDTIIHYYLTYNKKLRINLDKLNILDKNTKRFHRMINLKYQLDDIDNEKEAIGHLYKIIYPNLWEIYIEDFGFVKLEVFNKKIDFKFKFYQIENEYFLETNEKKYNYKIGDKIEVKILKVPGIFPNQQYKIIPKISL